jgi:hypothetical protein
MKVLSTLVALAALCAIPAPAIHAQSDEPACDGVFNVLRLSEITPTGSLDKFMSAVSAQQAWYSSHGYPDVIFAAKVTERDPQTKKWGFSNTQVLTYHYTKAGTPPVKRDAAWDAYVKQYNETSTIKETHVNCVPASAAPASLK